MPWGGGVKNLNYLPPTGGHVLPLIQQPLFAVMDNSQFCRSLADVRHDLIVLLSAAGGAYWPIATYSCPSFELFASIGGGVHRPLATLCPPSSCLAWGELSHK